MRRLAAAAELSTRTLYNLYGAKEDILAALMGEALSELDDLLQRLELDDPIARSRAILSLGCDQMTANAEFYRPLLVATDTRVPRDPLVVRRARALQQDAIEEAMRRRLLSRDSSPRLLAHQIVTSQMSAARYWASGVLSDEAFAAQTLHAWALFMLAAATGRTRTALQSELELLAPRVNELVDRLEGVTSVDDAEVA